MLNTLLLVFVFSRVSAFQSNMEDVRFPDVGSVSADKNTAAGTSNNHYMCPNKECENVPNYPAKDIEKIVIDKQLQDFFEPKPVPEQKVAAGRSGGGPKPVARSFKEDQLCPTEETIRYPRIWKLNGTEYTIVQNVSCTSKTGRCYQSVRVVKCTGEHKPCSEVHTNILQAGTTTSCEQEYSYSRLLVFNNTNHAVESNIFPIPCGCQCKLIRGTQTPAKARLESLSEFAEMESQPPISRKRMQKTHKLPEDPQPRRNYLTSNSFDYESDYTPFVRPRHSKPNKKFLYFYGGRYGTTSGKDSFESNVIPYRYDVDSFEDNETFQMDRYPY